MRRCCRGALPYASQRMTDGRLGSYDLTVPYKSVYYYYYYQWSWWWCCCADVHCVQLVKSDYAVRLLALLDSHPLDTGSPVTHHAVLSALRNLAIPGLHYTHSLVRLPSVL